MKEGQEFDVLPAVLKELYLDVGDRFVWDKKEDGVYYCEVTSRRTADGQDVCRCKVLERMA